MAYYGRILTIRYKYKMKIETVQATGACRNTDFRWCLSESWGVGCRDYQKIPCCFFLHWSNKEGKALISGNKKGHCRVYSAWGIRWWIKRGRGCKYSPCVCVFLPKWAGGGRGGLRDWLGSARLVEGFLAWHCLTITNKASCFDLVAVEIRLMLLFWKLVGSFHYFITYAE